MIKMKLKQIDAVFLDFDGVLTDNSVITSSLGKEYVVCSRSDGIAANYFRKIKKPIYIISSEKNNVGEGILRELLEEIFNIDLLKEMYNKKL